MKEFIEKLIARLEEEKGKVVIDGKEMYQEDYFIDIDDAISIVNELAEEYKDKVMIDGQYCWQTCGATEHCKECNRLCNGSIDYYENYDFMVEEHNGGWIPCSEIQPCKDGYYLITTSDGEIDVREYDYGNGWGWDGFERIIAWQPLPEPYKAEDLKGGAE